MKEMLKTNVEDVIRKARKKRLMKRIFSVLCVITILSTSLLLKNEATTLERTAMCGLAEHIHDESCRDESGAVVCGCEAHVHTDACYQEHPKKSDGDNAVIQDDEPDIEAESGNIEGPVDEIGAFELVDLDEADEDNGLTIETTEDVQEIGDPVYDLMGNSRALLSDIIAAVYPEIGIERVESVGESVDYDDQPLSISVSAGDDDFAITALRDFIDDDTVQLGIFTRDGEVCLVNLKNGVAEMVPSENDAETEESIEETDGETDEETDEENALGNAIEDNVDKAAAGDLTARTITIDAAELAVPFSLNALLARAAGASEAERGDGAEAPAAVTAYDEALFAIEQTGDDTLIIPLASFEAATIAVEAGEALIFNLIHYDAPLAYPAQRFEAHLDGMAVYVTADEGAFPEGTAMSACPVYDEATLDDIVSHVEGEGTAVRKVHAVDITFRSAAGAEIEPLIPISVVMRVEELKQSQQTVVVHMDDDGNAEVVEKTEEVTDTEIAFDAEAFSVYAVVVTERYISADGSTWNIQVTYGSDAGIPEGARLAVREIENAEYEDYFEQTLQTLNDRAVASARFFDISIVDNGAEIQPNAPVEVKVTMAQGEGDVRALHFGDDVEVIDGVQCSGDAVMFDAERFSVYGIVFTVDFEYAGTAFSINGCDSIRLSELLNILYIDVNAADVTRASFSNPDLVSVEALERDWLLTSLAPFETEEALTLFIRDGRVIVITVYDAQHITDLTKIIASATLSENDQTIPWPAVVRENRLYDLRLEFKEDSVYQFIDTDEWMTYPLPEGIDIGDEDFERTFTMDVGDVRLEGNILRYDAMLRMFLIQWNTADSVGFNKLKASNSAQFRMDLQVEFTFNTDKLDFGNDVYSEVIRDSTSDIDVQKTGTYNRNEDRMEYTVAVTSYGVNNGVCVEDTEYGSALTYNQDVTWTSTVSSRLDGDVTFDGTLGSSGFKATIASMEDQEVITFRYSAALDYEALFSGSGSYEETYNRVTAKAGDIEKEDDHAFVGELHYVELQKKRDTVNWGDNIQTPVYWTVTLNHDPKVGMAGVTVTDRIYAGDVEAMWYDKTTPLHVRVYTKEGLLAGEYNVPTSEWHFTELENRLDGLSDAEIKSRLNAARSALSDARAAYNAALDAGDDAEADAQAALIAQQQDLVDLYSGVGSPYRFASWTYKIPDSVTAQLGGQSVTIDNTQKYYYEFTYTTIADKTKMVFDGYVGNEVGEDKTDNLMQGGVYPPGIGAMPHVTKELDTRYLDKGSDEDYIYWKISFPRLQYDLTRCVIEDNNPELYGKKERVDVGKDENGAYDDSIRTYDKDVSAVMGTDRFYHDGESIKIIEVEGLRPGEGWQIASSTDTRTTFKFYRDKELKLPGLLAASDDPEAENTVTIHLRTINNADWVKGTMTQYWPREHTNAVTWMANAHQTADDATGTPDVRRIEKKGEQVGTIDDPATGISLPVFRFELYLTGISDDDFANGTLTIRDAFNTNFLQFVETTNHNSPYPNAAGAVTYKTEMSPADQTALGVSYWDQMLKGYSKTNKWVGPINTQVSDNGAGGSDGVVFKISRSNFVAKGYEPGTESDYCLRYSLSYYLVVKNAATAQALALLAPGEYTTGEYAGITKSADGKISFSNTATWNDTSLTAQTAAEADFSPLTKKVKYDAGSELCTYTIVINPQRLRLNNGELIRVEDDYVNLAVDYQSVAEGITTQPAGRESQVDWSYHGNRGTFWVPDETTVTITYKAQPIGDPGQTVTFSNAVGMLDIHPDPVVKTVKLNAESEGTAGDYNLRLLKYADNSMNMPLRGAVFQLFEEGPEGPVPMSYQTACSETTSRYSDAKYADYDVLRGMTPAAPTNKGGTTGAHYPTRENHAVGDYIYFATTQWGYTDIHLDQSLDGLALERGKQYYLQEIVAPADCFQELDADGDQPLMWGFIIDDMDDFGSYIYRDNGVLKVSNSTKDSGIVVTKLFNENGGPLDDSDKQNVTFEIVGRRADTQAVVYRKVVTYSDFMKENDRNSAYYGQYRLKIRPEELPQEDDVNYTYTITESGADVATHARVTNIQIMTGVTTNVTGTFNNADSAEAARTPEMISGDTPVLFEFSNTYTAKPVELAVSKVWNGEAENWDGAEVDFTLYRTDAAGTQAAVALYWDGTANCYKPWDDAADNTGRTKLDVITLDKANLSKCVRELPRYDANQKPYSYAIAETEVRYRETAQGEWVTILSDNLDQVFTTSVKDTTELVDLPTYDADGRVIKDASGNIVTEPGYAAVPTRQGVANYDLDHRESASLEFTNKVAELIPISVEKVWGDGNGNHADEEVTYDLYRTTEALPTGGERDVEYTISFQDASSMTNTTLKTDSLYAKEGDILDVIIEGKPTNDGKYKYNFSGLIVYRKYLKDYPWGYAFPRQMIKDKNGNDISNDSAITFSTGTAIDGFRGTLKYSEVHLYVMVSHFDTIPDEGAMYDLNGIITDKHTTFYIRNYQENTAISVRNVSVEEENLKRPTILEEAAKTEASLVRENMVLRYNETTGEIADNMFFPRADADGNEYTYFVLEHEVAGYEDGYKIKLAEPVKDEDDQVISDTREHTITISNKTVTNTAPNTTLEITKDVAFTPAELSADVSAKDFYFTVKNGNRYAVQNSGVWTLMTPTAYRAAGLSPYIAIRDGNTVSITGLPEGTYIITEVDDAEHDADIEGYGRETQIGAVKNGKFDENVQAKLTENNPVSRVIRNTYTRTPAEGSFQFSKLWIAPALPGEVPDRSTVAWPSDETIDVVFRREKYQNGVKVGDGFDEDFIVEYEITYAYNARENAYEWVTELVDAENDANDYKTDTPTTPAIVGTDDPGKYNNYALTLQGIRTESADGQYTYKYYACEKPNVNYKSHYGRASGTAAMIEVDIPGPDDYIAEGKAFVNEFIPQTISFSKVWYGQNQDEPLTEWPTRDVTLDPESDEGAVPRDVPLTEPVKISLRLGRRLWNETKSEWTDFDPTFDVLFKDLTGDKTGLTKQTDEGKIKLTMAHSGSAFNYTITGLKKSGTMHTADGDVSGDWAYYVFEDAVDGYRASYYDSAAATEENGGVSVPDGGKIVNTQLLGTLALRKIVSGIALTEDKTFTFTVRRKSGSGNMYLLQDGALVGAATPHTHQVTVEAGKTYGSLIFENVIPGDYEVLEEGTGADGAAQIPGYALSVSPVTTVREGEGENITEYTITATTVEMEANRTIPVNFTNAYSLIKTDMQFQKVWLPLASAENPNTPIEWPDGETITIELRRRINTAEDEYDVDAQFALVYTGTKQGTDVVWNAVPGESNPMETDADQILVTQQDENNIHSIKFRNLTRQALSGTHAGEDWEYYLVERETLRSDYAPHVGKVEMDNGAATVTIGSHDVAVGTEMVAGAEPHDSAIINRKDYKHETITKVWQDADGNEMDWPKDAGDEEIRISVIAKKDSNDPGKKFELVSLDVKDSDLYTVVHDTSAGQNRYVFTLYQLDPNATYQFVESDVPGYHTTYQDAEGGALQDGAVNNGCIVNTKLTSGTTSVTVKKVWNDDETHNGDKSYFRLYKAAPSPGSEYVQINFRPEWYYENGDPAVPTANPWSWTVINTDTVKQSLSYKKAMTDDSDLPGWQISVEKGKQKSYTISTQLSKKYYDAKTETNTSGFGLAGYNAIRRPQNTVYNSVFVQKTNAETNADESYYIIRMPASGNFESEDIVNIAARYILPESARNTDATKVQERAALGKYDSIPDNAVPVNKVRSITYSNNGSNTVTFDNLPLFDENLQPITYYVVEDFVTTRQVNFTVTYENEGNNWTVINTPTYKTLRFTKQWRDAMGGSMAWPSDGTNELPISLQVTRRLEYTENGDTKYSTDQAANVFSLTYGNVTTAGGTLLTVNGVAATAAQQARYALTVSGDSNGYVLSVAGLDNAGTLSVNGGNKSGFWDYRATETSALAGFEAPAYYESTTGTTPLLGSAARARQNGCIRNAQSPASTKLYVQKHFQYGDAHWPVDGFAFTLNYLDYKADEDATAQKDDSLLTMPTGALTIKTTTPTLTDTFGDIAFKKAGIYRFTIRETVPDDAENATGTAWKDVTDKENAADWFALNDIRYDGATHEVIVTVAEYDGALAVDSVTYGDGAGANRLTVTNTYAGKVGFEFNKAWLKLYAALPATRFTAWPAGEAIQVTLERYVGDTKDSGFALNYTIDCDDTTIQPTDAGLTEEQKALYALTRTIDGASNLHHFAFNGHVLDSLDASGDAYTYRLTETDADGYALLREDGMVYATSRAYAANGGVVVNRDTSTEMSLTKIWLDAQGVEANGWPQGKTIDLTLHWQTDEATPVTGDLAITGISPAQSVAATLTINAQNNAVTVTASDENPSTIRIEGLPYQYSSGVKLNYHVTEAAVSGYDAPRYINSAAQSNAGVVEGGFIINRVSPATQTMRLTKSLKENLNDAADVDDILWPSEGFDFTQAYVSYQERADAETTLTYEQYGFYDAEGAPLLQLPQPATATAKLRKTAGIADADDKMALFEAVKFYRPGVYTFEITEQAPADAEQYRRDESAHTATITVTDDGTGLAAGAPVYDGDAASLTVTNIYHPNRTFVFSKVWLNASQTPPASDFQAWPDQTAIAVTITRYRGGTPDADFELKYSIAADGTATLTGSKPAVAAADYALTLASATDNIYRFSLPEVLPRRVSGDLGTVYTYYVAEDEAPSGCTANIRYGTLNDGVASVKPDAVGKIQSEGVIMNQLETDVFAGGFTLPATGGPGTALYTVGGLSLILLALALLLRRKEY